MRNNFRKITALFICLTMCAAVVCAALAPAQTALSRYGSRGAEVREIQTRLRRWGYYSGNVDGIYGTQTRAAVVSFQRKNGLTADGVAGPKTLAAMGIYMSAATSSTQNDNNLLLLARIISAEAKGEVYTGQVAVGAVVLNRVKHPSFPNTISGVIYQPGAFSAVYGSQWYSAVPDSCTRAAQAALNGWDPTGGSIYYYNPSKTTNAWMHSLPTTAVIGNHVFSRGK